MNLDEQLRAALNLEAEMRTAPPLDTDGLITEARDYWHLQEGDQPPPEWDR